MDKFTKLKEAVTIMVTAYNETKNLDKIINWFFNNFSEKCYIQAEKYLSSLSEEEFKYFLKYETMELENESPINEKEETTLLLDNINIYIINNYG